MCTSVQPYGFDCLFWQWYFYNVAVKVYHVNWLCNENIITEQFGSRYLEFYNMLYWEEGNEYSIQCLMWKPALSVVSVVWFGREMTI